MGEVKPCGIFRSGKAVSGESFNWGVPAYTTAYARGVLEFMEYLTEVRW